MQRIKSSDVREVLNVCSRRVLGRVHRPQRGRMHSLPDIHVQDRRHKRRHDRRMLRVRGV